LTGYGVKKLVAVYDNGRYSSISEIKVVLDQNLTKTTGTNELGISTRYKCYKVYAAVSLLYDKCNVAHRIRG
jgi:hypothetical protein